MEFDSTWHLPGDQEDSLWHHCRALTQTNGLGRQDTLQDTALWMRFPFFQINQFRTQFISLHKSQKSPTYFSRSEN